ncbi:hypothetical protein RHS04_09102 [Rhizoctonia solani]|uniref:C2H2-type domain-containing protein n=1 Tax=Rhizoctonia solani TaxID=456999 RepID=A0A8H7H0W5_9AGAM|nr:hypothetical protein RHS04_09102 [Rhizoctonia solani]
MARENLSDTSHEELAKAVPHINSTAPSIEEDATKDLRSALGNLKIQCDTDDCCSSDEPDSPIPDTPMCKGYIIDSELAGQLLGERYYFTAPIMEQETSELVVFSLSPTHRMVSRVDENGSFHHYHLDRSSDSIVHFMIGYLTYRWDTRHCTLSYEEPEIGPGSSQFSFGSVHLYMCLEEAREFAQSNNPPVSSNYTPECPPLIDDNGTSPPSPASVPPTLSRTCIVFCAGYFGQSPDQKVIDQWVDHAVTTHQAARDGVNLKCPEMGCKASSRRPHALKTHLYTHYGIKPHSCAICNISVLTEANLSRHMKNIHTCPGCLFVAPVVFIKAHKTTCPQAAKISCERKGRKRNKSK